MGGVSEGHRRLTETEFSALSVELDGAWRDPEIARQQRDLADTELANWFAGRDVPPFRAYLELLKRHCWTNSLQFCEDSGLLDVGCGSGYYAELLARSGWQGQYVGVDYSEAMIATANSRRKSCPIPFVFHEVADARKLRYKNRVFPIVVSGCIMLHASDAGGWRKALSESARVADRWLMLHRTPTVPGSEHRYWRKLAYGVPCLEQHFARSVLADAWKDLGFEERDRIVTSTGEDGLVWESIMLRRTGGGGS